MGFKRVTTTNDSASALLTDPDITKKDALESRLRVRSRQLPLSYRDKAFNDPSEISISKVN
jgi:hypothetical protein